MVTSLTFHPKYHIGQKVYVAGFDGKQTESYAPVLVRIDEIQCTQYHEGGQMISYFVSQLRERHQPNAYLNTDYTGMRLYCDKKLESHIWLNPKKVDCEILPF